MLRIWLAGPLRLELDGAELNPPSSRRARLLLAMLALERGPQSRETLAARLWPDVLDESARVSLRTALVRLRAALGPNAGRFLDATRETIALAGPDRVWTDVGELERRLEAGEAEAALELYGGGLLVGLEDDWVYERREVLAERLAGAAGRRAAELEAAGDLDAALFLTRRQADLDPLAEAAQRDLIRRLAAAGDPAAALAAYQKLAKRLREQLHTVPSAATRELAETIRSRAAAEPERTGAAGQRLTSPGEAALVAAPATRYAQSGDVSIAYQVVGDGPLDLLYIAGGISHVDLQWTNRAWAHFLSRLASSARLITFDWRGTGLSDPVAEAPTFDQHMDDVHAVLAAAGSERAAVLGFSAGGLFTARFAAMHPERTEALILWDAFATVSLNTDDEPDREVWPRLRRLHRDAIEHWGEGRFLYVELEGHDHLPLVGPQVIGVADVVEDFLSRRRGELEPTVAPVSG